MRPKIFYAYSEPPLQPVIQHIATYVTKVIRYIITYVNKVIKNKYISTDFLLLKRKRKNYVVCFVLYRTDIL